MIDINKLMEHEHTEVSFAEIKVDKAYVKTFRKEHGLTQVALANILGVTKKAIEKWEQGASNVGGSSAVLLKLLNENPGLIDQLYSVKKVSGQSITSTKAKQNIRYIQDYKPRGANEWTVFQPKEDSITLNGKEQSYATAG